MLSSFNAWQLMLWIILLEVASIPLFVAGVSAIIDAYFKSKERHMGKMASAVSNALEEMTKKMSESREQANHYSYEKLKDLLDKLMDDTKTEE